MSCSVWPVWVRNGWNAPAVGNCCFLALEGRLDLRVGDLDVQLGRVGLVPVGPDQEVHHLAAERGEELAAVVLSCLSGVLASVGICLRTWAMQLVKFGGSLGTITGAPGLWDALPLAATYIQWLNACVRDRVAGHVGHRVAGDAAAAGRRCRPRAQKRRRAPGWTSETLMDAAGW